MDKKIVLAGFDLEVLELLEDIDSIEIIGYVDKFEVSPQESIYLGNDETFHKNNLDDIGIVLTMNIPKIRAKLFDLYKKNILNQVTHRTSLISKRVFWL